ncbi:hypothetical protein BU17DRAFT_97659 [Hysterangium stoloniferum]|nr:hypothetical protein BU17DRAFT_97659 [Hysterangium stoloniferum]
MSCEIIFARECDIAKQTGCCFTEETVIAVFRLVRPPEADAAVWCFGFLLRRTRQINTLVGSSSSSLSTCLDFQPTSLASSLSLLKASIYTSNKTRGGSGSPLGVNHNDLELIDGVVMVLTTRAGLLLKVQIADQGVDPSKKPKHQTATRRTGWNTASSVGQHACLPCNITFKRKDDLKQHNTSKAVVTTMVNDIQQGNYKRSVRIICQEKGPCISVEGRRYTGQSGGPTWAYIDTGTRVGGGDDYRRAAARVGLLLKVQMEVLNDDNEPARLVGQKSKSVETDDEKEPTNKPIRGVGLE